MTQSQHYTPKQYIPQTPAEHPKQNAAKNSNRIHTSIILIIRIHKTISTNHPKTLIVFLILCHHQRPTKIIFIQHPRTQTPHKTIHNPKKMTKNAGTYPRKKKV